MLQNQKLGGARPPWLYFRTLARAGAALGPPESELCRQLGVARSQIKCIIYRTAELSPAPIWVCEVAWASAQAYTKFAKCHA